MEATRWFTTAFSFVTRSIINGHYTYADYELHFGRKKKKRFWPLLEAFTYLAGRVQRKSLRRDNLTLKMGKLSCQPKKSILVRVRKNEAKKWLVSLHLFSNLFQIKEQP
jgi:hypothetical protein